MMIYFLYRLQLAMFFNTIILAGLALTSEFFISRYVLIRSQWTIINDKYKPYASICTWVLFYLKE